MSSKPKSKEMLTALLSAHQCRHCMQRISKERSKDQDTDVSLYTKGLYYYSGKGPFIYDGHSCMTSPLYPTLPPWQQFLTSRLKCTFAVLFLT